MATDTIEAAEGATMSQGVIVIGTKKQAQMLQQANTASALAGTSQSFGSSTHGGKGGKGGKQKSTPG